jgi:hypothetical protein
MMRHLLQASANFQLAVERSFDVVNTFRVAADFIADDAQRIVRAGATDRVLEAVYRSPSGVTGQNIRRFTKKTSLEREYEISEIWLINLISRYELWAESLPIPRPDRGGQFPSRNHNQYATGSNYRGYRESMEALSASPALASLYNGTAAVDREYLQPSSIDDALLLYRFYKECRNSFAHLGGRAKPEVYRLGVEAQTRSMLLHATRVGAYRQTMFLPIHSAGDLIRLDLVHIRALVSLLLRLVKSIDFQILLTEEGERAWKEKWQARYGPDPLNVPRRKAHRKGWAKYVLSNAQLPVPDDHLACVEYLINSNHVRLTGI